MSVVGKTLEIKDSENSAPFAINLIMYWVFI